MILRVLWEAQVQVLLPHLHHLSDRFWKGKERFFFEHKFLLFSAEYNLQLHKGFLLQECMVHPVEYKNHLLVLVHHILLEERWNHRLFLFPEPDCQSSLHRIQAVMFPVPVERCSIQVQHLQVQFRFIRLGKGCKFFI